MNRITYPCVLSYIQGGCPCFRECANEAILKQEIDNLYKVGIKASSMKIYLNSGFKLTYKVELSVEETL